MAVIRDWIWAAVAWGSGGPPHVERSSAWMTPCGWPVRWLQAPTRPFSSLRKAARDSRLTGAAAGAWRLSRLSRLSGLGAGGELGLLTLAEQGADLVRLEQAGQPEEVFLFRRARGRSGAELAAVVEDPVEVGGGVEGLEGGLVQRSVGSVTLAQRLGQLGLLVAV